MYYQALVFSFSPRGLLGLAAVLFLTANSDLVLAEKPEDVQMDAISQAAAPDAGLISPHEGLRDDVRVRDSILNVLNNNSVLF